jgi:hypothetical protein
MIKKLIDPDTNVDIGIGKSEENESANEDEQTSGGKST